MKKSKDSTPLLMEDDGETKMYSTTLDGESQSNKKKSGKLLKRLFSKNKKGVISGKDKQQQQQNATDTNTEGSSNDSSRYEQQQHRFHHHKEEKKEQEEDFMPQDLKPQPSEESSHYAANIFPSSPNQKLLLQETEQATQEPSLSPNTIKRQQRLPETPPNSSSGGSRKQQKTPANAAVKKILTRPFGREAMDPTPLKVCMSMMSVMSIIRIIS
jgi:hypothetical protein